MTSSKLSLYFAWLLACLMTLGSLYISLSGHREPCTLCWYERMCTFPLTIVLAIAIYKSYLEIFPYVILFPCIGIVISAFHVALQEIPSFRPFKVCTSAISCAVKEPIGLGPITPPMLVLGGSILMIILLILSRKRS